MRLKQKVKNEKNKLLQVRKGMVKRHGGQYQKDGADQ